MQTVLLKDHQAQDDYRGSGAEQLGAWLRQILANTLADVLRDHLRDRRDVRRETNLENALNDSSLRLAACAMSSEPSPSAVLQGKESSLRLAGALARLPEPQREAVTLKHFEGRPLLEVAQPDGSVARLRRIAVAAWPGQVASCFSRRIRLMVSDLRNASQAPDIVDCLIAEYLDAMDRGRAPPRADWLARNAEQAVQLGLFLDDLESLSPSSAATGALLGEGKPHN